jgi:hypothetical protein
MFIVLWVRSFLRDATNDECYEFNWLNLPKQAVNEITNLMAAFRYSSRCEPTWACGTQSNTDLCVVYVLILNGLSVTSKTRKPLNFRAADPAFPAADVEQIYRRTWSQLHPIGSCTVDNFQHVNSRQADQLSLTRQAFFTS